MFFRKAAVDFASAKSQLNPRQVSASRTMQTCLRETFLKNKLDIKFIRENPEVVKKGIAKKDADISLVDKAVAVDARRRSLQTELDQIKAEKNKLGREINKLSAEQRDARI